MTRIIEVTIRMELPPGGKEVPRDEHSLGRYGSLVGCKAVEAMHHLGYHVQAWQADLRYQPQGSIHGIQTGHGWLIEPTTTKETPA